MRKTAVCCHCLVLAFILEVLCEFFFMRHMLIEAKYLFEYSYFHTILHLLVISYIFYLDLNKIMYLLYISIGFDRRLL